MPIDQRIQAAVNLLQQQHANRQPFSRLPEQFAPRDADEAYAIQELFRQLREPSLGRTAGYKVALTSTVGGVMFGMLSTGNSGMEIVPTITIKIEMTEAKIGR